MVRVHSFDVFDTCLTRKVAAPFGVFYEVARKVFARLNIPSNASLMEDFVTARINAESAVRQQAYREDVTLDEIWRALIPSMGWQYEESLVRCELEAEEELITPVISMRAQVQTARRQRSRIVFVSDMYLPSEFIERQLSKYGFSEPGDGFYVSGELGKTKATGNLFRRLLVQENVQPSKVLHIGDNEHSDYAVPRKLGIRARRFEAARMTRAEIAVLQGNGDSLPFIRIAGAMRAFRLGHDSGDEGNIAELAGQFVAPFVMGFATWVLQRARENGVRRLYFLSRDCQLACKVAAELAPEFGGIECRYLYVSRQALFLPSADAISPEEMPWMRRAFEKPILGRLLAKIDLRYEDVGSAFSELVGSKRGAYRLESTQDWTYFWNALNTEPLKTQVNNVIAMRRAAARQYFESAGLFDDVSWAVVDLGWSLTCQQCLWKLLKAWGWPRQIQGYYFGLQDSRVGWAKAGGSEALNYKRPPSLPAGLETPTIFSHETVLEHVVGCADHPTVHHYGELEGGSVAQVFTSGVDDSTLRLCRSLQDEVLDFMRQNKMLVDDFSDPAICREVLKSLVTTFFNFPTAESVSPIRKLSAAVDQNGLDLLAIVKPLSLATALLPLLPQRRPFSVLWKDRCCWREGAMAITPLTIRRISAYVLRLANYKARIRRVLSVKMSPS